MSIRGVIGDRKFQVSHVFQPEMMDRAIPDVVEFELAEMCRAWNREVLAYDRIQPVRHGSQWFIKRIQHRESEGGYLPSDG